MTQKLTSAELQARLAGIKLVSLDVDGVLTDGGLYYTDDGTQMRKFNVKDGLGIKLAQAAGMQFCIVSAGKQESSMRRAETLGIDHVRIGAEEKLPALKEVADKLGIPLAEVAHIGDDLNDIPVMKAVGIGITVADAVHQAVEAARYITSRRGGDGAVREICDLIVAAKIHA